MGNVPISTKETTLYYPTDWLIEGGPTFEAMGCPETQLETDDTIFPLSIVHNAKTGFFGCTQQGFVLMESTNPKDIAQYVQEYVSSLQGWIKENQDFSGIDNIQSPSDS